MVEEASLDEIFRALANTKRRSIAAFVLRNEPVPFAKLIERLELSQSAASKHLAIMRAAGLVRCERYGGVLSCRQGEGGWTTLDAWFAGVVGELPVSEVQSAPSGPMYHLLSDAGCRRLLKEASLRPGSSVGTLASRSELAAYTASRKLKALAALGCIDLERHGRETLCRLIPGALVAARDWPNYIVSSAVAWREITAWRLF